MTIDFEAFKPIICTKEQSNQHDTHPGLGLGLRHAPESSASPGLFPGKPREEPSLRRSCNIKMSYQFGWRTVGTGGEEELDRVVVKVLRPSNRVFIVRIHIYSCIFC